MRKFLLSSLLTLICAAVPVSALAQAPQPKPIQTTFLDLYERSNDGFAGPVKTRRLANGVPYVLRIRGTASLYRFPRGLPSCGKPERKPIYNSRKSRNRGAVGIDPEFVFAALKYRWLCPRTRSFAPRIWHGFRVNTGKGYAELRLLGAARTTPRADHAYEYGIVGTGARAQIRVRDRNARDNYGRFKITVRRATATECLNGNAGRMGYATEAACVVAALPVAPVAPS